jgi:hypothetical protein
MPLPNVTHQAQNSNELLHGFFQFLHFGLVEQLGYCFFFHGCWFDTDYDNLSPLE